MNKLFKRVHGYLLRVMFNLPIVAITGQLLGRGPDYESMVSFIEDYQNHYFGVSNNLIAIVTNMIGNPEFFQFVVYSLLILVISFIPIRSLFLHPLLLVLATIICTGNYRIGLAAVIMAIVLISRRTNIYWLFFSIFFHYTAAAIFAGQLFFSKKKTIAILLLLCIAAASMVFQQEFSVLQASLTTHIDPGADTGSTNVFASSVLYAIIFGSFFKLTGKSYFGFGAVIALVGAIFQLPVFTRLLIYFKVLVLVQEDRESNRVLLLRCLVGGAIILLQLRNEYYWY